MRAMRTMRTMRHMGKMRKMRNIRKRMKQTRKMRMKTNTRMNRARRRRGASFFLAYHTKAADAELTLIPILRLPHRAREVDPEVLPNMLDRPRPGRTVTLRTKRTSNSKLRRNGPKIEDKPVRPKLRLRPAQAVTRNENVTNYGPQMREQGEEEEEEDEREEGSADTKHAQFVSSSFVHCVAEMLNRTAIVLAPRHSAVAARTRQRDRRSGN